MLVSIVDYGMCNLDSVARAVAECGAAGRITSSSEDLQEASAIILPGVGAFRDAASELRNRKLDVALRRAVLDMRVPFLGICLGMQLMADVGFEGGETEGLGLVAGRVVRLAPVSEERVPHVGWNEVHPRGDSQLFEGIPDGKDFYFVHSYHFVASAPDAVLATTPYCGEITTAIHAGAAWGVQFHPEKSQKAGFKLLKNFLALAGVAPC